MRARAAIAAATALNLPFGTLYAFSVFLKPLETLLGVGRAELSVVFGLATVTLTGAMVAAPSIYRRMAPWTIALACGACSAAGLLLAAHATTFAELALGYGVLFGIGAGIGFIVVQQGVNQTVTTRRGLANGYVVSLYPLGAMLGAPLFGWTIAEFGIRATLASLAAAVFAGCALTALLLGATDIRMHDSTQSSEPGAARRSTFYLLATVFFLAAAAGLMVMSQAAGIVQAYGAGTALAVAATTFITGAVGAARIAGGWLTDRFAIARVAMGAQLFAFCGALVLGLWPGPLVAVGALAMIGAGYGIISGVTAAAIARYWDKNAFGRVAGRLYVAWCVAAITLPVIAGWIYDRTQGYGVAVWIAGALNLIAVAFAARLPKP